MASPSEKLAESLEILKQLQSKNNIAVKSSEISRTHRERLTKAGFLKSVTKGWYIATNPDEKKGDTTSWYSLYWQFCARYLEEKYGQKYCLSAEQSLLIHAGNTAVPEQLIVRSLDAPNDTINLIYNTSLYILKSPLPKITETEEFNGVRLMTKESALVYSSPMLFKSNPIELRTVLGLFKDSSDILVPLLDGSHSVVAGRLAGAFRNVGKERIADEIIKTMKSADFKVQENDPFENSTPKLFGTTEKSPYVNRIKLLWSEMRGHIIQNFPKSPGLPKDHTKYLNSVDQIYVTDAYHSLSIERYVVSTELIEKVRSRKWDLENEDDIKHKDAMAARGYWLATQAVKASIIKILQGKNSGEIINNDHGEWFRELFAPTVTVGLHKASDLAGYRTNQVYISNSMHTPQNKNAVRDSMPALFELIENEPEASVRAVLGHFIFVYIHPYMDGNGRMARFLMNAMLASGGYPWTVIPVEERDIYMAALEKASVKNNIELFANFISRLVDESLKGTPVAKLKIV